MNFLLFLEAWAPRTFSSPTVCLDEVFIHFYDVFMNAWSAVIFVTIFLLPPILVFSVRPDAPMWLKTGRLLFPIFIYSLFISYTSDVFECFSYEENDCWAFKLFFLFIGMLQYIMYLGWFEYVWRRWYKQIAWSLKKNLEYGMTSTIIIITSAIVTLMWIAKSLFEFYVT